MLRSCRTLITAGLVMLLSFSALGQATLKLKDGRTLTGRATRYDSETQTLYFRVDDGRDLALGMDDLDGRSSYLVNRSIVPREDGAAQLMLANFARDAGLYAHSARHYRYAVRAAPSLEAEVEKQAAIMRRMAADHCMAMAEAAIEAGNRREAERWLTTLLTRLPDEPQAEKAAEMLDVLYELVHGARDDELEAAAPDLVATDLRRGKQLYDSMVSRNKRGLQARSGSQTRNHFNAAIRDGERALREIDRVSGRRTDAASQEILQGYRQLVVNQIIETRLNLASQFMVQTSFNRAAQQVNAALALDPNNAAALSMRSRVEMASSRGFGWW